MNGIRTVLCPTDFSPLSEMEINLAAQICERFGARMVVQHNINAVPPVYLANAWMYSETHMYPEEEQEAQASRSLAAIIERLSESIPCEGKVTFGNLSDCILHLAGELPADLIVMGTHGPSSAEHVSDTDRVLTGSHCPVLTLREAGAGAILPDFHVDARPQTVLMPMDFSMHSLQALEYTLSLMDVIPLTLRLLHVEASLAVDDFLALSEFPHLDEQRRQRIATSLERLKELVPTRYLSRVKFEVRMGPVVEQVVACALDCSATLVIMGAHAKNVLDRLVFGANSQGVLHRSPCPVWLVPYNKTHAKPWVKAAASQAGSES